MPFQKGKSGNPTGRRPKSDKQRQDELEARRLAPRALKALERNLACGNPAAEVASAKEILDRAYGKATQTIHASVEHVVVTGDAAELQGRLRPPATAVDHTVQ